MKHPPTPLAMIVKTVAALAAGFGGLLSGQELLNSRNDFFVLAGFTLMGSGLLVAPFLAIQFYREWRRELIDYIDAMEEEENTDESK